ncbi:MAG: hypothetical protein Q7J35_08005 [Candidatus Methanoperedens sp.]|nr:hypothetical protein [Candidatus Methanoperedens sp.]
MKTLCIISCGNRKIWDKNPAAGPTKARFVYIGPFATKCRQYAERFYPSSWCILSAKYGILFPDDIVPGPYNVSFNDRKTAPITNERLSAHALKKGLKVYDEIVVLGGKNYVTMVSTVFPEKNIIAPLRKCKGFGYMMGFLKNSINKGII